MKDINSGFQFMSISSIHKKKKIHNFEYLYRIFFPDMLLFRHSNIRVVDVDRISSQFFKQKYIILNKNIIF